MDVNVTILGLFQLVVTVMLTSVVIYPYTVTAFNFFRKFYTKEEDGEKEYKCNGMLTVRDFSIIPLIFSFSDITNAIRSLLFSFPPMFCNGIEDGIEPPDGDAHEALRILFDLSLYFFVIIILLAIMQGLWLFPLLLAGADHLDCWEKVPGL
ncbi:unnamed protein product [Taenia asiatica]|uniref:RSN1_TM domain-containing protein n=1 Tax=Taenia asiatica TaxID=60517 RepID=A0A0R3VZX0_TAEAS|nr:unnamed protein product [Taenia asiatica]